MEFKAALFVALYQQHYVFPRNTVWILEKSSLLQDLPRYIQYSNPSSFYEEKMRSLASQRKGPDLVPLLQKINSQEFLQFVEQNQMKKPLVEINPNLALPSWEIYKTFMDECSSCCSEEFSLRVVFHGTPEHNIKNILRNGLDPHLRHRQALGQGEYFACNPVLPYQYCRGGQKMVVFAVIAPPRNIKHSGITVVDRTERQLPIATLSFTGLSNSALQSATSFQAQVSALWNEKLRLEKTAQEAKSKEKIIQRILEREYEAASDLYLKACRHQNNGMPVMLEQ